MSHFPENKKFAFTILDDTDSANLSNIEPIYRYLHAIGMRTTKTVWPLAYEDHLNSPYMHSATLQDKEYSSFMLWLSSQGFEITWHGATMESSDREDVVKGLDFFKSIFGYYPSLHVNHAMNADNLYWGLSRFDSAIVKFFLRLQGDRKNKFYGDHPESIYYWGDHAENHIKYCRSFSFSKLNSLNFNPSFPYLDSKRSLVDYWFATADADSVIEFEQLVTKETIDKLVAENGICILSTHLAKGYCKKGELRSSVKNILDYIVAKDGWFVPVSELLNWRLEQGRGMAMSVKERCFMEYRWVFEKLKNKLSKPKGSVPWWDY